MDDIFLVQVNGALDFCYYNQYSIRLYDVHDLRYIGTSLDIIINAYLLQITPQLVSGFQGQPYLIINNSGLGLAQNVYQDQLQYVWGEYDINLENAFIKAIKLPEMSRSVGDYLPEHQLPYFNTVPENLKTPLLPRELDICYHGRQISYKYGKRYYPTSTNLTYTSELIHEHTYVAYTVIPDSIYYSLEYDYINLSDEYYARILEVSADTSTARMVTKPYHIRFVSLKRIIVPDVVNIISGVIYDTLPYKQEITVVDKAITIAMDVSTLEDEFLGVLREMPLRDYTQIMPNRNTLLLS